MDFANGPRLLKLCSRFLFHAHDNHIISFHSNSSGSLANSLNGILNLKRHNSITHLREYYSLDEKSITWNKCPSGEKTVIARSYLLDIEDSWQSPCS
mmetsp:Transcript_41491/g.111073  ORF Transcript_41491/g.111073 Transcript_41491/m.111073 type:complete len:97 (-) Transcript_41491:11-301(-)